MTEEAKSVNEGAIRRLLMALLCFVTAMTWALFTPATATAQYPWFCADGCELLCDQIGSTCAGFLYSEGICEIECN